MKLRAPRASRSVSMPRPSSARPDVNYRIDEHARCHDIIRAQATRGHEFLDFRDDIVGRHRHQRIEIPRGMAVGQIAGVVTAVGVDESEVGANGFLHQKRFPADIDAFLPTTENGVDSHIAQYAAESSSAGAHPLRQNPLRADFSLDLAVVDHLAKPAIKTDVAHDDPHHLPACNQPDRKSTRLNSSHVEISYAVFCLKKKKNK